MATPKAHAIITASGYERWSHCTAAPRYEERFPDAGTTVYAAEGTLAHSICELYGRKKFTVLSQRKFNSELKKLKENELFQPEMEKTAEFYVDFLTEKANEYKAMPHVAFEVQVDLSDYIPEGFGTCDCIMIGDDILRITDYKHGKGVPVSSIDNGQMRLYALGALKYYSMIYGDTIKRVCTAIVQPRITEDVTEEWLTVDELQTWGETVAKPKAQAAFSGLGTFCAGDWCRFCKGKAECRARAEYYAGFSKYVGAEIEGRMSGDEVISREVAEGFGADVPPILSDAEVAGLLVKAEGLASWYADLQDYAQQAILSGRELPGWKVVEGKRIRAFTDEDKALDVMRGAGYDDAVLYDRKPKTLAQMEKLAGKKAFADLMGGLISYTPGKPTLVPESDKREPYQAVGPNEFAGVSNG